MFRIKNARNATVAKPTAIPTILNQREPPPPTPKPQQLKPPPSRVNVLTITREPSSKKEVGKKPEVQRRLVSRGQAGLHVHAKADMRKTATKAVPKVQLGEKEEKQSKKEQPHHQQAITTPIVQGQTAKAEQKILAVTRQLDIQKQQHDEQKEKQRQAEEEKQREEQQKRKRREEYLRQKQLREKQQELRNAETLKLMMEKVNARRKARQENRERQQNILETQQQTSLVAGAISLSDPLAHVEMSEAVMDRQVNLILSMKFAGYPNQQALQRQQEELERINRSYLLVRADPGNRLIKGLGNFRVELFNRVGELVLQAQSSLGPTAAGLRVVQSDSRDFPQVEGMQVTRGMQGHVQSVLKKTVSRWSEQCAICLGLVEEGERVYEVGCGHVFHARCLQEWLSSSGNCPSCRYNIKFGQR